MLLRQNFWRIFFLQEIKKNIMIILTLYSPGKNLSGLGMLGLDPLKLNTAGMYLPRLNIRILLINSHYISEKDPLFDFFRINANRLLKRLSFLLM